MAVIELGGGYKDSDLTTMWTALGMSGTPTVHSISVDGGGNRIGSDADTEVALDVQIIGGLFPADIDVFFAPNTDAGFYDAISQAVYSTSKQYSSISISWGAPEAGWSTNSMNAMESLFAAAADKGISVFAASGDNGSSDGLSGNNVDFPSSAPHCVGCGGTRLSSPSRSYSGSGTSEVVWTGGGGGLSRVFSRPSWQAATNSNSARAVPDIAGEADPATGYVIYVSTSSVSSPGYFTVGALRRPPLQPQRALLPARPATLRRPPRPARSWPRPRALEPRPRQSALIRPTRPPGLLIPANHERWASHV